MAENIHPEKWGGKKAAIFINEGYKLLKLKEDYPAYSYESDKYLQSHPGYDPITRCQGSRRAPFGLQRPVSNPKAY